MTKKKKAGRHRIGQPITVVLTEEQRKWIDAQVKGGATRASVIRGIIEEARLAG